MMACAIVANPAAASPPYAAPVASFTPGDSVIGTYENVDFTDTSTGFPTSWQWYVNGALFSTLQNPSYFFTTPAHYYIVLVASNSYGADSETHIIIVE